MIQYKTQENYKKIEHSNSEMYNHIKHPKFIQKKEKTLLHENLKH